MEYSIGAAYQFISKRFGGPCREEEADLVVGIAPIQVANRDPERVFIVWVNLSENAIWIAPSNQVTITHGIRLEPLGGLVTFDVREDAILPALEWWAISILAGQELYRLTVRREVATMEPKIPKVG